MSDPDFRFALLLQRQLEHESKLPSTSFQDRQVALLLQQQFEQEASAENPSTLVYDSKTHSTTKDTTKSLVDPSWEIIDPTPDIYTLFVAFNERFFWNKLLTVCVSWSKRMTSCAGICSYQGRGGMCTISLSEPLLKLRPRKDLVETLLHEMIHAYLFVTHNNKDRDGHGPEFHKHMYRINKESGCNITVYHSFHDEVRLYQQHWWRCNGPCQNRKPYFGMVKRATNRAPGPNDLWWAEHARTCGGEFIKVNEPEKKKKSNKENKNKKVSSPSKNSIVNYFPVLQPKNRLTETTGNIHGFDGNGNIKKIGTKNTNATKNVGSSAIKTNSNSTIVITKNKNNATSTVTNNKNNTPKAAGGDKNKNFSTTRTENVLGGPSKSNDDSYSAVRNHWLNKFSNNNNNNNKKRALDETIESEKKKSKPELVTCPVCQELQNIALIDQHLDSCLQKHADEKIDDKDECVICGKFMVKSQLEEHVLLCLTKSEQDSDTKSCQTCNKLFNSHEMKQHLNNCVGEQKLRECPVCDEKLSESCYDRHIEKCLNKMYDDIERRNSKDAVLPKASNVAVEDGESIRHQFENSYLTEDEEKKYNCPFCFKMFLEGEMSDHLNECLKSEADAEEEQNKSILLEELDNVDF